MRQQFNLSQYQPQWYAVAALLAAALGSQAQQALILDDDSEFILLGFLATTDQDARLTANTQGQTPNNFSLRIQVQSTGKYLMNAPIERANLCATANKFQALDVLPIRFMKKTQLIFEFTNLTAVATNLQVVMRGYKAFQNLPTGSPAPGA